MSDSFLEGIRLAQPQAEFRKQYRLYYDKVTGEPRFYTMADEVGDFIEITIEQYAAGRFDVLVQDGKIIRKRHNAIGKLIPADEGYGTMLVDASIVGDEQHWRIKTYE